MHQIQECAILIYARVEYINSIPGAPFPLRFYQRFIVSLFQEVCDLYFRRSRAIHSPMKRSEHRVNARFEDAAPLTAGTPDIDYAVLRVPKIVE